MQTLGGLSLMAALVICYLLYFHSQDATPTANGVNETRPVAMAPAHSAPGEQRTAAAPHSEYKADLDRAHAAARQIQLSHDEATSF
jgi:hypothetical protein